MWRNISDVHNEQDLQESKLQSYMKITTKCTQRQTENVTNRKALFEDQLVGYNVQAAFRCTKSDWDIKMLKYNDYIRFIKTIQ